MAIQFSRGQLGCGESQRELHLIDIENLLLGPRFSRAQVASLKSSYLSESGATPTAHFYLGASASMSCANGRLGWAQGLATYAPGKDGAERALLAMVPVEFAARFSRVVLGSGDGYFASYAADLQARGTRVTVVCQRHTLSGKLRLAVRDVRYLPPALCGHAPGCDCGLAA